jgi:anaerobic magnesium-protoporphyrin IX monomethyl ester cyclase
MKVLLVNPGKMSFIRRISGAESNGVNHGIASIIAFCNKKNIEIDLLDFRNISSWNTFKKIVKKYDLIGYSIMSPQVDVTLNAISKAKEANPNIISVVGGIDPTVDVDKYVKNHLVDYIICGEGEIAFYNLIKKLDGGGRKLLKNEDKIIIGEKVENLDDIPFINRELWPKESPPPYLEEPYFTLISSRSCIYNCRFCQPAAEKMFGSEERVRSPKNFFEEILLLKREKNLKSFFILDDNAFQNRLWLEEFIRLFEESGIYAEFIMSGRSDNVYKNRDLLPKLKKLGLKWVIIGFESGSDKILRYLKKGATVDLNEKAAFALHKNGIMIQANIMFGFPIENKNDIMSTYNFLRKISPVLFSPATYTPYPGNYLADELKNEGLVLDNTNFERFPDSPKIKGVNYFYIAYIIFRLNIIFSNGNYDKFRKTIYFIYTCFNLIRNYIAMSLKG